MFVATDIEFGVPFVTARPRLMELIAGRALADASRAAFDEGLAHLAHLAQPGRPSPARLMRVQSLPPAHSQDRVTAALRWEAIGAPGGLFPVLDADLTLTPASAQATRMSLAGVYRPPFGYLNIDLDPATTGQVAWHDCPRPAPRGRCLPVGIPASTARPAAFRGPPRPRDRGP